MELKFSTANVLRVQEALQNANLQCRIVCLEESARTAELAAQAIGCQVGQIVKSLMFKAESRNLAVLAMVSGKNRLDEKLAEQALGFKLEKANAAFVRETTGFAIGGVAPVGHLQPSTKIIDQDLLAYDTIWAAAGHPNTVFAIKPAELVSLVGAQIVDCALKKQD
jgi:prolyl-tRNA editing enzyme YbaK/EbsC (Cys-tRNA(Pro) deacylase)